jgi:hypothetical protein
MSPRRYACALGALVLVAALATVASAAPPYPVRDPQVPLNGEHLQKYFDGIGESINVYTDQLNAQTYIPSVSGNSAITLMIELGKDPAGTSLGVYDPLQATPELYEVFPGSAAAHWSAMVSFLMSGDIVVNLFNASGVLQSNTVYPGVGLTNVGFYLQGPGGTFYSEDARNGGGAAQALMYAGTGRNGGDFWVCWEDLVNGGGSDIDFDDAVLLIQSLQPVPATAATWGLIKAQYR